MVAMRVSPAKMYSVEVAFAVDDAIEYHLTGYVVVAVGVTWNTRLMPVS